MPVIFEPAANSPETRLIQKVFEDAMARSPTLFGSAVNGYTIEKSTDLPKRYRIKIDSSVESAALITRTLATSLPVSLHVASIHEEPTKEPSKW